MIEVAALTYGAVASFVIGAADRNRKAERHNPPQVQILGWLLMSFSGASGVALLGYAGMQAIA